jgi:hypothetical protein
VNTSIAKILAVDTPTSLTLLCGIGQQKQDLRTSHDGLAGLAHVRDDLVRLLVPELWIDRGAVRLEIADEEPRANDAAQQRLFGSGSVVWPSSLTGDGHRGWPGCPCESLSSPDRSAPPRPLCSGRRPQ